MFATHNDRHQVNPLKDIIMTTRKNTHYRSLIVLATLTGLSLPALAETQISTGLVGFDSPYKGNKEDMGLFLEVYHKGERTTLDDRGLTYRITPDHWENLEIGATLSSAGMGYDANDATSTEGMKDRDASLDAGVSIEYRQGENVYRTTLVHDITNTHEGTLLDAQWHRNFAASDKLSVSPFAGLVYTSQDYNQYYFGVEANEQTQQRAAYQADASVSAYLGYKAHYELSEQWGVVHSLTYAKLGSEIRQSSVVDDGNVWITTAGIAYRF